jgi:hypothetical protein
MARVLLLLVYSFVLLLFLWAASTKLAARIRRVELKWAPCFQYAAFLWLLVVMGNVLSFIAGRLVEQGDLIIDVAWLGVLIVYSIWFFDGKGRMENGARLDWAASTKLTLVLFGLWFALVTALGVVVVLV